MTYEGRWNRAKNIAWYRLHRLTESHIEDALNESIERKSKGG